MKLITNNPRLNALANQYAVAVHRHVMQQNKGGQFDFGMNGQASYVAIMGGVPGIRDLVDSYLLGALKLNCPQLDLLVIQMISKCLDDDNLTPRGLAVWQFIKKDMYADRTRQWGTA
ncbi:hypothetical protein ABQ381_22330 [Serratia fonticola]|jgi:hypothetical protein|uniref:hypothetical protein n=1 Tax=Serratia fonticola TaxID=47917 RepID=UPI003AAC8F37